MTQENVDIHQEKERLALVGEIIRQRIEAQEKVVGVRKEEVQHLRKHFWEDMSVNLTNDTERIETFSSIQQEARVLAERERGENHAVNQLRMLYRLANSPYFGRIDFIEEGQPKEQIYIGLSSLMDHEEQRFLVYDWRAPISSMYYDFTPGKAYYKIPSGEKIEGEMTLKRQYIIREGQLQHMFDTELTIGDTLLQQVLSQQSSDHMKSIVATIQREQNLMIRDDSQELLIVQGAAGSGKTSAALQRVAYLLYKHRNRIQADQIVLFSPNALFNQYISHVLPELGEVNMKQMTFQQILQQEWGNDYRVEDLYEQTERLYLQQNAGLRSKRDSIRIKSSAQFFHLMNDYFQALLQEGMIFHPIVFRGKVRITSEQLAEQFYSFNEQSAMERKLTLLRNWILHEIEQMEKEEIRKKWVTEAVELLDDETIQKAYRHLRKKGGFSRKSFDDDRRLRALLRRWVVRRKTSKLRKQVEQLKFINYRELYIQFLQSFVPSRFKEVIDLPPQWEEWVQRTKIEMIEAILHYEDAAPLLYLKEGLQGFANVDGSIRYVLIDEAQDYTPFQFAYIRKIYPRAKLTVLGDVNQGIYAHNQGARSFTELAEWLNVENVQSIQFSRTYRSTKEIMQFSQSVLPQEKRIQPFERRGKKPMVYFSACKQERIKDVMDDIQQLQKSFSGRIGLICKTMESCQELHEQLKDSLTVQLVTQSTLKFTEQVVILPSYLAKGIEFDAALILDVSEGQFTDLDRNLFYTICTRAMHELHLFISGNPPVWWDEINPATYEKK